MTIIKTANIPYLNEDVIEKYKNVIIISTEGMMIKMNSLILCAMSQSLKLALLEFDDFDGDHTIITEFSLAELKQVKDYCTKGTCEAMSELIMNSFGLLTPLSIENNIQKFKSETKSVNASHDNNSMITSEIPVKIPILKETIPMKDEIYDDIKEEPHEYSDTIEPHEYLDNDNDFDYTTDYEITSPIKRKNCPNCNIDVHKSSFARHVKKCKAKDIANKSLKDKPKPKQNSFGNFEKFLTLDEDSKYFGPGKTAKKDQELSENELELFKTFELPKPLEKYISKPKNIEDLHSKIEYSKLDAKKRFQCSQCELRSHSVEYLKAHEIKFHNPSDHLPCPYCVHTFYIEEVEKFKQHMFKHYFLSKTIKKLNSCIQCGLKFTRPGQLKEHLEKRGPFHNEECSQCPKKLTSYEEYQDHVNMQHYGLWKYR